MAAEIHAALSNASRTQNDIKAMFENTENARDTLFSSDTSYQSGKDIWGKLGYDGVVASDIQSDFNKYLSDFEDCRGSWDQVASAGNAGKIEYQTDDGHGFLPGPPSSSKSSCSWPAYPYKCSHTKRPSKSNCWQKEIGG